MPDNITLISQTYADNMTLISGTYADNLILLSGTYIKVKREITSQNCLLTATHIPCLICMYMNRYKHTQNEINENIKILCVFKFIQKIQTVSCTLSMNIRELTM